MVRADINTIHNTKRVEGFLFYNAHNNAYIAVINHTTRHMYIIRNTIE